MKLVHKVPHSLTYRLKSAFKTFNILIWFKVLFIILVGVFLENWGKGMILIYTSLAYSALLGYLIFQMAKIYVFNIEEVEQGIRIDYLRNNKVQTLSLSVENDFFRTHPRHRSSPGQIQFLKGEKIAIKQYAIADWSEEDIETLEKELKRLGFKKPYGENL